MSKEAIQKKNNNNSYSPLYLDTNILWPFSISFDHPLIQILLELSIQLKIKIFLPEVVYLEWLQKKREDIESEVNQILNSIKYLKNKYLFDEIEIGKTTATDIFNHTKAIIDYNLKNNNIEVIKIGKIDIEKLIAMSIQKIKPFEEKREKGFRDSVILFSILNHAKSLNKNCMFITDDRVYQDEAVSKIAKEYGVELIIAKSILDFKEIIESLRYKIAQNVRAEQLNLIKVFLESKKDDIERFIREEGKFDLSKLSLIIKTETPDFENLLSLIHDPPGRISFPIIRKLNRIDLIDIVVYSLPVETSKELIPLSFTAKLKLNMTIERIYTSVFEETISLNKIESVHHRPSSTGQIADEEIEENFPIYATVKKEEGKYTELILKQVGTPFPLSSIFPKKVD